MKKIITSLFLLGAVFFISCSDDEFGEVPPFDHPAKSVTIEGLQDGKLTLHVEKTNKLEFVFDPVYASDQKDFTFEYKSSDESVISFDKEGIYTTGTKPAKATVTITPTNKPDMAFSFEVEVIKVEVEEISTKIDYSKGMTLRLAEKAKIGDIIITPTDASLQAVSYSSSDETVAKVVEIAETEGEGESAVEVKYWAVEGLKAGTAKITVASTDKPEVSYTFDVNVLDLNVVAKTGWTIFGSSLEKIDGNNGKKENLIDGNAATYLALAKPGKLGMSASKKPFFIVDMGSIETFDAFQFTYSNKENLSQKPKTVSIYGSDDMAEWMEIKKDIAIQETDDKNPEIKSQVIDLPSASYRYVKVEVTTWDSEEGDVIQLAEFDLFVLK